MIWAVSSVGAATPLLGTTWPRRVIELAAANDVIDATHAESMT